MTTDEFTTAARAEAEGKFPPPRESAVIYPLSAVRSHSRGAFLAGAEWARTHLAAQEPTDAESLVETDAGLTLANAAWQEGLSAGVRACNEGGPWKKPESPYSAPLLARIAARAVGRDAR